VTNEYQPWLSPAEQEREILRREGKFVGIGMLFLSFFSRFLFTGVVLLLIFSGVPLDGSDDMGLGNTAYLVLYMIAYTLMMGLPMVLSTIFTGNYKRPFAAHRRVPLGTAVCLVLIGLGGCVLANLASSTWFLLLERFGLSPLESAATMEATPLSFLLNLIMSAVLPALLEEVAFRGFVLQSVRKLGDPAAIVISALLFGAMHENIWQIPFATMVGLILGWIVVKTENIWIAVIIHFLNNTVATVTEYIDLQSPAASQQAIVLMFSVLLMLAIGATAILLYKRSPVLVPPRAVRTNLSPRDRRCAFLFSPWIIFSWLAFGAVTVWRLL
jgi:membrane protease YdiL (CAAX protease family)